MTMRAFFISMAAVATLVGCGGGSGKPAPGQSCQYNSECQAA